MSGWTVLRVWAHDSRHDAKRLIADAPSQR